VPGIFSGGKGGQCLGLTTWKLSCADCLEMWEPTTRGTLRACVDIVFADSVDDLTQNDLLKRLRLSTVTYTLARRWSRVQVRRSNYTLTAPSTQSWSNVFYPKGRSSSSYMCSRATLISNDSPTYRIASYKF
jgi:hypothetical protein